MSRRRKRPQARPAGQQATPPLQPAYPEFSGPGSTAPLLPESSEERPQPPPRANRPELPAAEEHPESAAEPAPAATAGQAHRSRRRRKRGGRGRQRPGAPAPAPSAEAQPEAAVPPEPEAEPVVPAETAPAAAAKRKPSRGVVVLAIGLPGSGKSSWFRRRSITPLSSDLLRTLLFDNITEQRYQDLVFSSLRSLLRARLIAGMPWNYVDATNLAPKERRGWIKMAREFRYEVHAVFFDVPLEVCQERNRRRLRIVPDDVMQRMAAKLRPPTFEEGFSKVTVVRVKRKEGEPGPEQAEEEEPEAQAPTEAAGIPEPDEEEPPTAD